MGIDFAISLGISWASHRTHSPAGPILKSWLECALQWLLEIWVSVTSNIYVYHFLNSPLPFQNIGLYVVWPEWEPCWHLGQHECRVRTTVYFRKFSHGTSMRGRRKEEGGREAGLLESHKSWQEPVFYFGVMLCSFISVCVAHRNTHSLFCNVSVLLIVSFPFSLVPGCFLQSLD